MQSLIVHFLSVGWVQISILAYCKRLWQQPRYMLIWYAKAFANGHFLTNRGKNQCIERVLLLSTSAYLPWFCTLNVGDLHLLSFDLPLVSFSNRKVTNKTVDSWRIKQNTNLGPKNWHSKNLFVKRILSQGGANFRFPLFVSNSESSFAWFGLAAVGNWFGRWTRGNTIVNQSGWDQWQAQGYLEFVLQFHSPFDVMLVDFLLMSK